MLVMYACFVNLTKASDRVIRVNYSAFTFTKALKYDDGAAACLQQ